MYPLMSHSVLIDAYNSSRLRRHLNQVHLAAFFMNRIVLSHRVVNLGRSRFLESGIRDDTFIDNSVPL